MYINSMIRNDVNNTNGINWLIDYTGKYSVVQKQIYCNVIPLDTLHSNYINPFDLHDKNTTTDKSAISQMIEQKIEFLCNFLNKLLEQSEFLKNEIALICQKMYDDYLHHMTEMPTLQTFCDYIKEIPSDSCQAFVLYLKMFCQNSCYDMFAYPTNIKVSKGTINIFDLRQMPNCLKSAVAIVIQEYLQKSILNIQTE